MKSLLFIFLLVFSNYSQAFWSAFAHVTPDTQEQYGFDISVVTYIEEEDRKYRFRLPALGYDFQHAWLIHSGEVLEPFEQEGLRNYIWSNLPPGKEILKKEALVPIEIEGDLYYEIELGENQIFTSYIYIDFPHAVHDGGFYYSIDLPSYVLSASK